MSDSKKIKLAVGKKYVLSNGLVAIVHREIHYKQSSAYVLICDDTILGSLYNEDGDCLNGAGFVERECIEKPVWDWSLCKFAKFIFRSGDNWYYTENKPLPYNNGYRFDGTSYGQIPKTFRPSFSGSDKDSLMERPADE